MEGHRGELHANGDVEGLGGQHHRDHGGHGLALLMDHDGVLHGVLQLGLVEVQGHVHALLLDELHDGVVGALGQQAVGLAGPVAVGVADIHIGQGLAAGIVDVHLRIRPGVQLVGVPVTEAPHLGAPVGLIGEEPGIGLAYTGVGGGAVVLPVNDDDLALGDLQVLHHQGGGHDAGGLLRVGAAPDQEGTALHAAVKDIDVAVVDGALDSIEVVAELLHFGDVLADHHRLLVVAVLPEQVAGHRHAEGDDTQRNRLDQIQFLIHLHSSLLQPQQTQNEGDHDDAVDQRILDLLRLEEAAHDSDQEEQRHKVGADCDDRVDQYQNIHAYTPRKPPISLLKIMATVHRASTTSIGTSAFLMNPL